MFLRFLILCLAILVTSCSQKIQYSAEEVEFIQSKVFRVAGYNGFPYLYTDPKDGKVYGPTKDYLELITKKTGIQFQFGLPCQMLDCLESLKDGNVDIVTPIRPTPERAIFASFSRPYLFSDAVLMKRVKEPRTVGIGRGYAIKNYFINHQHLVLVEFDNDEHSIMGMLEGKVDSAAMDEFSARVLRKRHGLRFDEVALPYEYPLTFGVLKNNNIMRSVLDKAIASITPEEHEAIKRKWK
jgi:ABC-type amino acid transport substrate-binding protein